MVGTIGDVWACKNCHAVFARGLGRGACAASPGGGCDKSGPGAQAYALTASASEGAERGWSICAKCTCAFFAEGPGSGACAAGGAHERKLSIDVVLAREPLTAGFSGGRNFRRCKNCEGLFLWAPDARQQGECPASPGGGGHDHGGVSEAYALPLEDAAAELSLSQRAGLRGEVAAFIRRRGPGPDVAARPPRREPEGEGEIAAPVRPREAWPESRVDAPIRPKGPGLGGKGVAHVRPREPGLGGEIAARIPPKEPGLGGEIAARIPPRGSGLGGEHDDHISPKGSRLGGEIAARVRPKDLGIAPHLPPSKTWFAFPVEGEIAAAWGAEGGKAGPLGEPTGFAALAADGETTYQTFAHGAITSHPAVGVAIVRAPMLFANWRQQAAELGPPSGPQPHDGRLDCERGLLWRASSGRFVAVTGAVYLAYLRLGGPGGAAGVPSGAREATGEGLARQAFANGELWQVGDFAYYLPNAFVKTWWEQGG
ncbi:MAG TPA: hypothetical protein VFS00_28525, partial [Polyangiaceae bacterium]|nr:hypothetical protein [Polyangiaceae bacterium]